MNVFVTTLSTIYKEKTNLYSVQDENGTKKYCSGISANEPGAKYILSSETIDRIVITGSDATYTTADMNLINGLGSIGSFNPDEYAEFACNPPLKSGRELLYFVYRMSEYLRFRDKTCGKNLSYPQLEPIAENLNSEIVFVPLMRDGSENLSEIIRAIRGDNPDEEIVLFVDVQGGSRTDSYVMNAVFSILHSDENDFCRIGKVVATDFSPTNTENRIIDETARYRISELVSGMNAFIRYGKAHAISSYLKQSGMRDKRTIMLAEQMVNIDEAISVCDISKLKNCIQSLNSCFSEDVSGESGTAAEIFRILEGEIRKDYGNLLILDSAGNPDIIELIEWCAKKRFIHQALVILETEVPELLYSSGILFCNPDGRKALERCCIHGDKDLDLNKAQADESAEHYLVKSYSGRICITDKEFCTRFEEEYPRNSDNSRYYFILENLVHEVYLSDEMSGKIQLYSALDENDFTPLLAKYCILADQRNKVSHTVDSIQNRWGIERLIKETLDFAGSLRNLTSKARAVPVGEVIAKKRTRKNRVRSVNTVEDNSPEATYDQLNKLAMELAKLKL